MGELFDSGPKQFGFDLGDAEPAKSFEPDREAARRELNEILVEGRSASSGSPWDERTLKHPKLVFP